jgi:hypothetical protein
VVSIAPANGATDVPTGSVELRVEFDRPMRDRSWSVCRTDRPFPQVSTPDFDDAQRVFTLQMVLEPGRTYGLSLNCASNKDFASEDGIALEPLEIVFTTRGPSLANPVVANPVVPNQVHSCRPGAAPGLQE